VRDITVKLAGIWYIEANHGEIVLHKHIINTD